MLRWHEHFGYFSRKEFILIKIVQKILKKKEIPKKKSQGMEIEDGVSPLGSKIVEPPRSPVILSIILRTGLPAVLKRRMLGKQCAFLLFILA